MRAILWFSTVLLACGGGSTPTSNPNQCARDVDCDDGVACTRDACVPSVGGIRRCQNEPRDELCGAGERCVVGGRDLAGCRPEAEVACLGQSDGVSCEVSDPCATGPGTCRSGRCETPTKVCSEAPCRKSLGCDPGTGDCRYETLPDGTMCEYPADPCRPARCKSGLCEPTGGPLCDDQDPCTQDVCQFEGCEHRLLADGTPCDDGDPCTVGESCRKGMCVGGGPRDCDDRNDCTSDDCDPASGCVNRPIEDQATCFADANRCRAGLCEGGTCVHVKDVECEDHDPCTRDRCDPSHGCLHEAQSNVPCDDGNRCTKDDQCNGGKCIPGPKVTCDDQDACTSDTCDPAQGCVFKPITPCCGNRVVEADEHCDAGASGSAGCGPNCRFRVVTLTGPPSGGRFPSVAWSGPAGNGLIAYEATPVNRVLVARRVGPDLAVSSESPIRDYKGTAVHDLVVVPTPGGPGDFLIAVSRPVSVDLFALDRDAAIVATRPEVWAMWDPAVAAGRVRVGPLGSGRFLVAWQDGSYCAGSNFVPLVRAGVVDAETGFASEPVEVGSGSCDPWSPMVLGDACGGEGSGVFVLVERTTGAQGKIIRHLVLPYDEQGLGAQVVVSEFPGDASLGAACAIRGDGQAYLMLYLEPDAVTKGVRVRTLVVNRDGGLLGGPWTIQDVSGSAGSPEICIPTMSGAFGLADGRFLIVCAMVRSDGQGNLVASSLEWRLLGPDGKAIGTFVPLGKEQAAFAYGVRMSPAPGGNSIAVWYETDYHDAKGGWQTTPGWLRLFVVGKGTVW